MKIRGLALTSLAENKRVHIRIHYVQMGSMRVTPTLTMTLKHGSLNRVHLKLVLWSKESDN